MFNLLHFLLLFFLFALIARLVLDYTKVFARDWKPAGIVGAIFRGVYAITNPPLKIAAKVLRPVKILSLELNVAFLALFVITTVLLAIIEPLR